MALNVDSATRLLLLYSTRPRKWLAPPCQSSTRLNRRMHNKSFTVDGLDTIVGGRVEAQNGKLAWVDPATGTVTAQEPGSSTFRDLALQVIGWLPVE